jgi:hypothetical protein
MAPAEIVERDGTRPNPPVVGALAYLLLNLPVGIVSFVFVVTMLAVGVATAVIWIGVPVLAVAVLAWRAGAQLERARVHAMLGTYIATPHLPRPPGLPVQWKARVRDAATWKGMAYFLLLLPVGIAEFTVMVSLWSASMWLLLMPVTYSVFPDQWQPVVWGEVFTVGSWVAALPLAGLGAILLAMTASVTKQLGMLHARFARAMLGPSQRLLLVDHRPTVTGWAVAHGPGIDLRTHACPGV